VDDDINVVFGRTRSFTSSSMAAGPLSEAISDDGNDGYTAAKQLGDGLDIADFTVVSSSHPTTMHRIYIS